MRDEDYLRRHLEDAVTISMLRGQVEKMEVEMRRMRKQLTRAQRVCSRMRIDLWAMRELEAWVMSQERNACPRCGRNATHWCRGVLCRADGHPVIRSETVPDDPSTPDIPTSLQHLYAQEKNDGHS